MHYTFKLIIFGDASVGKTSLIHRYVTGSFKESTQITIGVEFTVKQITVDGEPVDLQIWDFGGEDRFRFILPAYCMGAQGGVFMYDTTSPSSLQHMNDWMKVIREKTNALPVLIVGTKVDLEDLKAVDPEEACAIGRDFDAPDVIEVSAKNGQNVEAAFEAIARLMIDRTKQRTQSCASAPA
jgi:small GTP-binding protein